jgi:hypothetical protein
MNEETSTAKLWLIRVILPLALVVGVGLLATTRPTPSVVDADGDGGERLHKIGLAINDATTRLGRPPATVEELRPFLAEVGKPDQLLFSPVDGRPYVILWGVDVRSTAVSTVLAYEQVGSMGRRYVLTATAVVQLTDDELAAAEFPAGHRRPD